MPVDAVQDVPLPGQVTLGSYTLSLEAPREVSVTCCGYIANFRDSSCAWNTALYEIPFTVQKSDGPVASGALQWAVGIGPYSTEGSVDPSTRHFVDGAHRVEALPGVVVEGAEAVKTRYQPGPCQGWSRPFRPEYAPSSVRVRFHVPETLEAPETLPPVNVSRPPAPLIELPPLPPPTLMPIPRTDYLFGEGELIQLPPLRDIPPEYFKFPVIVRAKPSDIAVSHARAFGAIPPGLKQAFNVTDLDTGVSSVVLGGTGAEAVLELSRLNGPPAGLPVPPDLGAGRSAHVRSIEVVARGATLEKLALEIPLSEVQGLGHILLQRYDPQTGSWVEVPAAASQGTASVVLSSENPGQTIYTVTGETSPEVQAVQDLVTGNADTIAADAGVPVETVRTNSSRIASLLLDQGLTAAQIETDPATAARAHQLAVDAARRPSGFPVVPVVLGLGALGVAAVLLLWRKR